MCSILQDSSKISMLIWEDLDRLYIELQELLSQICKVDQDHPFARGTSLLSLHFPCAGQKICNSMMRVSTWRRGQEILFHSTSDQRWDILFQSISDQKCLLENQISDQ